MDEIEKRLRDSTDACIKSFENWVKQSKSLESREALMEAMHEVRKVVSRVEIEIAISERDRLGSRPLPIPPHRSSRKPRGEGVEEGGDFNTIEDESSFDASMDQPQPQSNEGPRRQHGAGQHGRNRRPMPNRGGGSGGGNTDNQQQ